MNAKGIQTLEYDKIKHRLATYVQTEMGQKLVAQLQPSSNIDEVNHWLAQTSDGADVFRLKGGIPLATLVNIKPYLKRLEIEASLNAKELAAVGKVLRATSEVKSFLRQLASEELKLEQLYRLGEQLETLPAVSKELLVAIEGDGHVTDEASPLLKSLRQQISVTESTIREKLADYTRGKAAKYLSNAVVTIRNDRYVIPVKAEYRGQFGGVVHDQSSSGATLFVEPQVIVTLNNRLKQQQAAEKEEIRRILRELSQKLAPYTKELAQNAQLLGQLDFINAKARYAHDLRATLPLVSSANDVYLRQVWHPLLDQKTAVRNDIAIGKDYQAIVITGPNTGGKTITLKTLGLVQLMGQSGLFIPAFEESRIGVFSNIFADIGDEQSIEQSLSTFSSHMTNIVEILANLDERSLVLFDELGAGTDPQEGAALAISILDAVGAKGAYVVATTHYPELKAYGYERPETINASMEFDEKTLKPTYRLLIGIPGRSNALDISLRLGLDPSIVTAAKQLTSQDSQDLNQMIADLVSKRHNAEENAIEFKQKLRAATKLHQELSSNFEAYLKQKEHLLETAKKEANEIVAQARVKADEIISDLRQLRLAGGQNIKENELMDAKGQLNALEQPLHLQKNKVLRRAKAKKDFHPNDDVLVKSYGQRGVLLAKVGNHAWEVQLGILKMKIDEADLEKIPAAQAEPKQKNVVVRSSKTSHVSPNLDLRGKRYEEAMTEVDRYIDAALLAGYGSVTIVHGKGTGALRQGITSYLQANSAVKRFEFAPPNAGGNGATIVYFK